jgi:sugar phosphate isomerase/epimerase
MRTLNFCEAQMQLGRRNFLASLAALGACATQAGHQSSSRPIGIQLYALGPYAYDDLDATFAALAEIGYAEVELSEGAKPASEVRAALGRAGLTCCSIHTAFAAQPAGNVEEAAARSADYAHGVGAAYVGPSIFPFVRERPAGVTDPRDMIAALARSYTRDDWLRVCDILNRSAAVLWQSGLGFEYHNHNVEFAPFEGGTIMDFIVANTDLVKLQVDVGWVAAAGVDVPTFLRQHTGRVRSMHVKDLKASTQPNFALRMDPTEVGNGMMNWPAVLQAGREAGVQHFLVEQEPPFERPELEAARISFQYLRPLL